LFTIPLIVTKRLLSQSHW